MIFCARSALAPSSCAFCSMACTAASWLASARATPPESSATMTGIVLTFMAGSSKSYPLDGAPPCFIHARPLHSRAIDLDVARRQRRAHHGHQLVELERLPQAAERAARRALHARLLRREPGRDHDRHRGIDRLE